MAPGFIDMHVHLREPGIEHAETIETGARAAAAGGFTSICCMPNTLPVNDSATVTSYIIERARKLAVTNVFPIGAITKNSAGEELSAIGSMKAAGVVAISDDGRPVMNARVMRRAMEFARSFDLPVIDHCEDLNLSAGGDMHEGFESVRLGLRGIPASSEDVMVARDILLAELTGARFHVAHISTRNAMAMVAYARQRGLPVTCEATPHHFALTDRAYAAVRQQLQNEAAPAYGLRCGRGDRWHRFGCGRRHRHRPRAAPRQREDAGVRALPVRHHRPRNRPGPGARAPGPHRQDPAAPLVALFTTGPASVLHLDRGTLSVGAPADVTIFSTDLEWTYDVNQSFSKSRNSPFDGHAFRGGPVATIVNGAIVWQWGRPVACGGL